MATVNSFHKTEAWTIELPTISEKIPYAIDDFSLAFHLGIRNKILWYFLQNIRKQYHPAKIPKASGGFRQIQCPSLLASKISKAILFKVLNPIQEELGDHVTAYRKGRTVLQAIERHLPPCPVCEGSSSEEHSCPRNGVFIKMDLKDFFTNTRRAWIRRYFNEVQGYSLYVGGLLAGLMTLAFKNEKAYGPPKIFGVPQGAPASGAICNIIADWKIDPKIQEYLAELNESNKHREHYKWVYSRYSDDMALTCGAADLSREEVDAVVSAIRGICYQEGYPVNEKKTKVLRGHHVPKMMLGVTINTKPNVPRKEYLRLRAIIHNCLVHGIETQALRTKDSVEEFMCWLHGKVSYVNTVNKDKGARLLEGFSEAKTIYYKQLEAKYDETID